MIINQSSAHKLRLDRDQSSLQMEAVNQLLESGSVSADIGKMYPALEAFWQASLPEIDAQIQTYFLTVSRDDPEAAMMLASNLHNWLNEQEMDNFARQELYLLTRGDDFLGLVESRIEQMREDGRLEPPAYLSQSSGSL